MVYGTAWFGLIHLILGINLLYNIFAYRLITLKKLPVLIFHVSFLFILVGAGITRYFGIEGILHIRNGESSNEVHTSLSYIQLRMLDANGSAVVSKPMYLSKSLGNDFSLKGELGGKSAELKYLGFVPNADYAWIDSSDGESVLELVFSNKADSRTLTLRSGDHMEVGDLSIAFNAEPASGKYIKFSLENGEFYISNNINLLSRQMGAINDTNAIQLKIGETNNETRK